MRAFITLPLFLLATGVQAEQKTFVESLLTPEWASRTAQLPPACRNEPSVRLIVGRHPPVLIEQRRGQVVQAGKGTHATGVAYLDYSYSIDLFYSIVRDEDLKPACLQVSEVRITTGEDPASFWIDPTIEVGSCDWHRTVEHELTHIHHLHEHFDRIENIFGAAGVFSRLTAIPISSREDLIVARDTLMADANSLIKEVMMGSISIADKRNGEMDTEDQYARLYEGC